MCVVDGEKPELIPMIGTKPRTDRWVRPIALPSSLILKKNKLLLRPKAAHNTTSQLQRQIKRKKKQKKLKYTKIIDTIKCSEITLC